MNKFLKFWLPLILWMGVIFFFSSVPDLKSGLKDDFILRKIAHIIEYAILAFLFIRALKQEKTGFAKTLIFSIILSLFYALSDEYHQTFVLGRHGSFKDVGIDSIGILLIGLVWYIKIRKRSKFRN